ncbi:sigma factor-like helix-turn-helix DNA-binding protein [Mycolicibacterium gilvum]|uniref:sigma factor-like helix-turn-helix DNA-binding protein n=1 Tax=Mycolicibacterium gilvum TaxID=1804 RepID=UPI001300F4F0|nr:sigma factor-like helix-turn-helix DNA-binding protein [Mycolicibacterium gilvum]
MQQTRTLVEALGFPKNSQYMAKVEKKLKLAALNNIPVVSVTHEDIPNLLAIFSNWLSSERDFRSSGPELPPRPDWPRKQIKSPASKTGHNSANAQARAERIARCRKSVELQVQGLTRKQIAERLGVSETLVKSLLRDGKFYANPNPDFSSMVMAVDL